MISEEDIFAAQDKLLELGPKNGKSPEEVLEELGISKDGIIAYELYQGMAHQIEKGPPEQLAGLGFIVGVIAARKEAENTD